MSSTTAEPDTEETRVAGTGDSAEKYLDGMSGDAEGFEAESPEARQAKAEALAHARAARAARAAYARLASQQAGVPSRNPQNKIRAESLSDMVVVQGDRIGRTEASLAATRIADQIRLSFLDDQTHPAITGLSSYLPLLLLKPAKRGGGVGGFVSDPRVWSFGALALVVLGDMFKDKIKGTFDDSEHIESEGNKFKGKVAEMFEQLERELEELRQYAVKTRPNE